MTERVSDNELAEYAGWATGDYDWHADVGKMARELIERCAADANILRDKRAAFKLTADLAALPEYEDEMISRSRVMELVYR